jgi:putative tryptophan/tyrosine transport system substrate-binding protein
MGGFQDMDLRRRDILAGLLCASAWPLAARAQSPAKTIAMLGAATPAVWGPMVTSFEERLRELGWIDGRTAALVYRWAEGDSARYAGIAAEFVAMKVDVIVTVGSAAATVMRATSTIPVVLAAAVDPVASGFVQSLSHPGGNVTGLSLQSSEIGTKRLEILREAIPGLKHLAVMANAGYPGSAREAAAVRDAANKLGLTVDALDIHQPQDLAPAIASVKDRATALYICTDSLVVSNSSKINAAAREANLATMWGAREWLRSEGGFISYGPNETGQFRQAADYVDRILKGANPADLPVAQPTKIDLVVNLKTAKALGLTIPETFLLRADEVIE